MGFFSYLFGTGEYAQSKLSKVEQYLSKQEIQKLVSEYKTKSLSSSEEAIIEKVIELRRKGDGKISLWQIDEVLKKLVAQKSISKYDREGVMKVFIAYLEPKG
ncbi:MAG: hypothetical protein HYV41_04970 [Candidatus Magasanikbacteria bacterium]|nr:hypothetical protein [Candidatus Magasanikbacteria bacterium]